jgi:hypothetical protein
VISAKPPGKVLKNLQSSNQEQNRKDQWDEENHKKYSHDSIQLRIINCNEKHNEIMDFELCSNVSTAIFVHSHFLLSESSRASIAKK